MGVSSMMIGVRNKYCFPKSKVERNSKQRRTPPQSDGVTKIEEFLGGRQFELLVTSFLVIGAISTPRAARIVHDDRLLDPYMKQTCSSRTFRNFP
jgi:hypothetical protein